MELFLQCLSGAQVQAMSQAPLLTNLGGESLCATRCRRKLRSLCCMLLHQNDSKTQALLLETESDTHHFQLWAPTDTIT